MITTTTNKKQYTANGVGPYNYDFLITDASQLVAYLDDTKLTIGMTITGVGNPSGGTVTFDSDPGTGTLSLIREVPITQETDYTPGSKFPIDSVEASLDKLTMVCQQLQEQLDRAFLAGPKTAASQTLTFPDPTDATNYLDILRIKGDGTGIEAVDPSALGLSSDVSDVQPSANTVVKRDSSGRAKVIDPSATDDIATKNYVDTSGTEAATASKFVKRDTAGRAKVVDPSASDDIATKNYVDTTMCEGSYGSRGQLSDRISTTQYRLTALEVMLVSSTDPQNVYRVVNPSAVVCDISVAGPVANGRDQSSAFVASDEVAIFWIYKPSDGSLASIASLATTSKLQNGPTMPSGYTAWSLATIQRLDGSGNLQATWTSGDTVYYEERKVVLNGGAATTETAVSTSAYTVTYTLGFYIDAEAQVVAGGGGGVSASVIIRHRPGMDFYRLQLEESSSGQAARETAMVLIPPTGGQQLYYLWGSVAGGGASGASLSATLLVMGYKISNGGR